jgi:transposase
MRTSKTFERASTRGAGGLGGARDVRSRKLQHSIVSKALGSGVPVILVEPEYTSSLYPKCSRMLKYVDRLAICKCGFKGDRDRVGAMNIWLKALS